MMDNSNDEINEQGISRDPVYNMMVVLKETGLKPDVLRAWERRYDLPHPQRTAGNQRIYSAYDIAVVKWLQERQGEGLSISRAVKLWKDLTAAGHDPWAEVPSAKASFSPTLSPVTGISIELLRQKWLDGCLAFDAIQADDALNQAFALYPVEKVCSAILQQGLKSIGDQWYLGKISIQQEHFASALATRRLETLITALPHPTRTQTILIGCPPGELHAFPALLLSLFLLRTGLKVVYLGADIPFEQLEGSIKAIRPNLVVLIAQQLVSAASLASMSLAIRERGIPVAFGGLIFNQVPALLERVTGTFLGENLEDSVDRIERLLIAPRSTPGAIEVDGKYDILAGAFRKARPSIEFALFERLQKSGVQMDTIEDANAFFGGRIAAALDLGDIALLEGELDWAAGLIVSHQPGSDSLERYLGVYRDCVRSQLGADGAPITEWINAYLNRHALDRSWKNS